MANVQYTQDLDPYGFDGFSQTPADRPKTSRNYMQTLTNALGAALSLGLLAGVGLWGYELVMRDVSGIPVVQAASGEMRVRPENPGGQLALHQGLAVNEVAADGEASGPTERLVLAPRPTDLRLGDARTSAADAQQIVDVDDGEIDAMVEQLKTREGAIEASPLAEDTTPEPAEPQAETAAAIVAPPADLGPGLRISARPQLRPTRVAAPQPAAGPAAEPAATELREDDIPAGTRLVQLGALDTPEKARATWDQLAARFGHYLDGKQRVIMTASSGGREFYRLRAMGFTDLADARRFCSTLVAEGAECIPVVTR